MKKNKIMIRLLLIPAIYFAFVVQVHSQTNYYKYVDPFIGSVGDGNVVVGPSCPFGMAKPGPDCSKYANAGYKSDMSKPVLGFSQVHVSGTGGGAKYGNVSIMPFIGNLDVIAQNSLRENETTALGYYSVLLKKWLIKTDITASPKVAFYKFGFNSTGNRAVKIDAGEFLNEGNSLNDNEAQFFVGSEIKILSDYEVCGYNRVRGGWNAGGVYTVYFHVVFDKPFKQFKTWKTNTLSSEKEQVDNGEKTGGLLGFGSLVNEVKMKIGISFISTLKAKQNVYTETPGWDFEEVLHQTEQKWEKLLRKIEIDKNASDNYKKMFYTGLYHTMLMPVDRTGENPLWQSKAAYYDDFYAIWDTYRSSHPLITLIDPKRQSDIVNSLIDIYQHDGYMPDARSGNSNGRTQGGSNCDVLIADAYVKGLKGIDYQLALKAMLKNADVSPGGNEEKEGRGGLADYNKLGYVSYSFPRSGTRTIEYSFNDYCISVVANGLGEKELSTRFSKQANNWQNLWRNYTNHGSTGFIMPKDAKGNWVDTLNCNANNKTFMPYHPLLVETGQCVAWWSGVFYEASSWEYSLSVPHDIGKVLQLSGGANAFEKRLDTFFANKYYNVGNEPSFLSPMLYHWLGKPSLSSDVVLSVIDKKFNDSRKGIPGNDDSGAMSSWLAFHMMGIYPNAGHSYYLIHTPMLAESIFHLDNGKDFKITAKNLSAKNKYIKSAKLNGKPLLQTWIEHSDILNGGQLELEMTDIPSSWGNGKFPPSLSLNNSIQ